MKEFTLLHHKELKSSSPLFEDYLYDYSKLGDFYSGNPQDMKNYLKKQEIVTRRKYPREELVAVLEEQNRLYGAPDSTMENIKKLQDPQTSAIVTGQQVGLFGGPLFTLYKAITVIKLSQQINVEYGLKTVPVFWMASDDDDLDEALVINIVGKENQLATIKYDYTAVPKGTPAAYVKFNASIQDSIASLFEQSIPSEFHGNVRTTLESIYKEGTDTATAFAQWMTVLLGKYGLIFINPADARVKKLGLAVFERELKEGSPSTQWVQQASEELEKKGYHRQLSLREGTFNLFYIDGQQRKSIKKEESNLLEELSQTLQHAPEKFSPNVVLRPLFQDTIFPTIAYVAGPHELAYFAQLSRVYQGFDIPMPLIVPRATVTMLEPKIRLIMEKYQLSMKEILGNVEEIITNILKQSFPEEIDTSFNELQKNLDAFSQSLQEKMQQFDPTLVKSVESTKNSMQHQLEGLSRKIMSAHKKKNDITRQQLYRVSINLYPASTFQERVLNVVPYLNKYGFDWFPSLVESIRIDTMEHQVIEVT